MRNFGTDCAAFARDLLGVELQPHQLEAILAHAFVKTILKGRQSGGTVTLIVKGGWDCYRFPRHLALYTSASERQVTEIGERALEVFEAGPIRESITRRTSERITFTNGSEMVFVPNNARTIRGFGVRGLLRRRAARPGVTAFFDECAHAENGDATRRAIEYPLATAPPDRREFWLLTTPTTSDAWPMKYHAMGQHGEPGYWSARWPSELNKYVDRAWLAQKRRTTLPGEVATEIDGLPADDAQALFAPLLPQMIDPALPWPVPPRPGEIAGVGIDLALPYSHGADASAALLLGRGGDEGGERWTVLDCWRERTYREADLLDVLDRWRVRYHVARFVCEQYGSTGVIEGALALRLPIETVAPTPANQTEAFTRLFHVAREGRLCIPVGAVTLLDELRLLRHSIGETGVPHFAAPGGRHDDLCFALAWAARATGGTAGVTARPGTIVLAGRPLAVAVEAGQVALRMHPDDKIVTPSDWVSLEKQEQILRSPGADRSSRGGLII